MQVPLSYAEDIIGVAGSNIAYIRRTSKAILSIQESRGMPDEITVEIKGTSAQVQMAQQLIQVGVLNSKLILLCPNIFSQHPPPLVGTYSFTGVFLDYLSAYTFGPGICSFPHFGSIFHIFSSIKC